MVVVVVGQNFEMPRPKICRRATVITRTSVKGFPCGERCCKSLRLIRSLVAVFCGVRLRVFLCVKH